MPRGKNYVNNNKGVGLQASKKKSAPSMEQCFYGKGCTRENCIYRHDGPGSAKVEKSSEPCMPFLAGLCTFSASGCRKRHPGKAEAERLIAKYKQMKCRYGQHCKTTGCLYIHPKDGDDNKSSGLMNGTAAFPPLMGTNGVPRPMAPAGAWKPMQPTGATANGTATATTAAKPASVTPPIKSAWQPAPPTNKTQHVAAVASPPPAPVWGKGINPILANHSSPPVPVPAKPVPPPLAVATVSKTPFAKLSSAKTVTPSITTTTTAPRSSMVSTTEESATDSFLLNIHAKEFVPGGYS